ncbi:hypothetical protein [Pseudomonas sp. EL_65y_Pfl1_R32]|uniref:hypothetical protein n=1 Tax=Pseudomonas sp. EL_65y_Pfl1_R32 TaxID=3088696 RepID=UPI0030DA53BA
MKIITYVFLIVLSTISSFADADNIATRANAHMQSLTEEERAASFTGPLVESMFGCGMTQSAVQGDEFGKHECVGNNNQFNSGTSKVLNPAIFYTLNAISIIAGLILSRFIYLKIFAAASTKFKDKKSIITAGSVSAIILIFASPVFVNEQGIRYNLFTKLAIQVVVKALDIDETHQFEESQKTRVEFPKRFVPNKDSGGAINEYNAISFQLCTSSMSIQQAAKQQIIKFTIDESKGEIKAFHQVGSCILDISFLVDMNTESISKRFGLPSYLDSAIETAKRIVETEYTLNAKKIADNIIKAGRPTLGVADTYTPGQLDCNDEASFNLRGMSPSSIKDYAFDAAKCMHGRAIDELNKVPTYTESLMPADRNVRICSTVDHSAGQGTNLNQDSSSTSFVADETLESTLRACVERSCAEDSSPKNCSDSINFYNVYFNNRFMTNPNILTILPKILFTEFQNNQYSTPGETLANSMKVDMYQSGSILISENNNKVIFTVDYERAESDINLQYFLNNSLDSVQLTKTSNDWSAGLLKAVTVGENGVLGIDKLIDCLNYPSSTTPSGRECGTVFVEIQNFGQTLVFTASLIKAELRVNQQLRKNTQSRSKEAAAVNGTKSIIDSAIGFFGTTGGKIGIVSAGIAASAGFNDIYNPVGLNIGPEAMVALAVVVSVPQMQEFLDSLSSTLLSLGYILIWSIPIAISVSVVSVIVTLIVALVGFLLTSTASSLQIINGTTVDRKTDYLKFIIELAMLFIPTVCYTSVLYMTFRFIKALFIYKIITLEMLTGSLSVSYTITSISDIYSTLVAICIYLFVVLFICVHMIRKVSKIREIMKIILFSKQDSNLPEHANDIVFAPNRYHM